MRRYGAGMQVIALLLSAAAVAQSLPELARREEERRRRVGPARWKVEFYGQAAGPAAAALPPPAEPAVGALERELMRRGPRVWRELRAVRREVVALEKDLLEAERRSVIVYARGRRVPDATVERMRRELRQKRQRVEELEREWRLLQEQARRIGLRPARLRNGVDS